MNRPGGTEYRETVERLIGVTAENLCNDVQSLASAEDRPLLPEHILLIQRVVEDALRRHVVRMLLSPIDQRQAAASE